jgi:AGCS family alanine or glycine:cation symporter
MKKKLLSLLLIFIPLVTFAQEKGLDQQIDAAFKPISDFFSEKIFFTIPISGMDVPFVLILLVGSALFFTI